MAALGKRSTAPEEECNLDPWGQPWITDAELEQARARARATRDMTWLDIYTSWEMWLLDSGLEVPGFEEGVSANHIVQHAKRQREFLAKKKKEEEQEKEVQERSTAPKEKEVREPAHKKQKTEKVSDAERSPKALLDKMIKHGDEFWGLVVAGFNEEEYCKACAFEQKSPMIHRLRHTCGASNIHLDWRPEHDEEDEEDEDDEGDKDKEDEEE